MGPNQLFQRLVLLEQNDYWIGGQTWHGDLLSPLRIRHATTQPIRLLKTLHPRWSQNFRSDVLVGGRTQTCTPISPGNNNPWESGLNCFHCAKSSADIIRFISATDSLLFQKAIISYSCPEYSFNFPAIFATCWSDSFLSASLLSALSARSFTWSKITSSPMWPVTYPISTIAAKPNPRRLCSVCRLVGITNIATSPNNPNARSKNPIQLSVSGDAIENKSSRIIRLYQASFGARDWIEGLILIVAGVLLGLILRRQK